MTHDETMKPSSHQTHAWSEQRAHPEHPLDPGLALGSAGTSVSLAAGQLLAERYHIERPLERYSAANVFLAFDQLLRENIAIEVWPGTEQSVQRLRHRTSLARRIKHPNILRIHDVGCCRASFADDSSLYFITMQLVHGRSLAQFMASGQAKPSNVVPLARQIVAALEACHAVDIVHGQLSAKSVLVAGTYRRPHAVLLLGCGQHMPQPKPLDMSNGQPKTSARANGTELDLYHFGKLLRRLLAGLQDELPSSFADLLDNTRRCSLHPSLPNLLDIASRCTERTRHDCFTSAGEVLAALT